MREGLAPTGKESLSADDLLAWLDELQAKITGKIILAVAASRSAEAATVYEIPSVDLRLKGSGLYQILWFGMTVPGAYQIAIRCHGPHGKYLHSPPCHTHTHTHHHHHRASLA